MSVITLTSDYGLVDYRVSVIKGSILSRFSEAKIVDISHEIEAYDLRQTAYIVRNAYKFFPEGSVHIISVDSFFRRDVRSVLYKVDGHYFIAADNGILGLIFFDIKPEKIFEITLNNRFDDEVRSTTVDIFVPAAVHLMNGGLPEVIGRPLLKPKEVSFPHPVFNKIEKIIIGEVMYIDNYGNVVSNISRKFFEKSKVNYTKYSVKFRNLSLNTIFSQYSEIVINLENEREYHGKGAAVFNDSQLLELCIYKGNKNNGARSLFGMSVGEKIYVEFSK